MPILIEQVNGRSSAYFNDAATGSEAARVIARQSGFLTHRNARIHRGARYLSMLAGNVICDCKGGAISTASGSIMTTMIKGKIVEATGKLIAEGRGLLTPKEEPEIDLTIQGILSRSLDKYTLPNLKWLSK